MSSYLEPIDDGLPMRESGTWVAEKLDYVARYLNIFITSMRNKQWKALNYIDLFAGPGKCHGDAGKVYLGSPLLALTTPHPFDHYLFADLEPKNIEVLRQRCGITEGANRIQYFEGDSNTIVHQIVAQIRSWDQSAVPGKWSSCLNLAFLDPEGLELQWSTVAALAKVRTDLIIHYSQMGLERCMPIAIDNPDDTLVDRFFGSRDWRNIYKKYSNKTIGLHRSLIDFYRQNLCNLGYAEVKSTNEAWDEPLMRNTKNAPLYRLLFASKHPLGEKFWREITKINVHGQAHLF